MKYSRIKLGLMAICMALLAMPPMIVHSAGGGIEGKVTGPKGAAVGGAKITVIDPATDQKFAATSDPQGRYKVEGLSAGVYTIVVSATGFSEVRRDEIKVTDGAVTALDLNLDISAVEATVTVTSVKANVDPVYQQLRQTSRAEGDFAGPFATVSNLVIKRDAAVFTLRSGE